MSAWTPIKRPGLFGEQRRHDATGITVEVVRCYEGEWTVFLVDDTGTPCACPWPMPSYWTRHVVSYEEAKSAAIQHYRHLDTYAIIPNSPEQP